MKHPSVLHVSTVHPPYETRIFEREGLGLAAHGFRVDVAMNVDRSEVRDRELHKRTSAASAQASKEYTFETELSALIALYERILVA